MFEEFIENASGVSIEFNRNLRLLREQDQRYNEKKKDLEQKQEQLIANRRDKKSNEAQMKEIKELQNACLDISNEKVNIAKQIEKTVEKCLEKLKADFGKFSANMRTVEPHEEDARATRKLGIIPVGKRDSRNLGSQKYNQEYAPNDKQQAEVYCYCKKATESVLIGCDEPSVDR